MSAILLVEDRDSLRRMLERALTGVGHQVVAVGDLPEARAALSSQRFDLVLTDLKLPSGEGTELIPEAKGRTPIVVLTAYGTVRAAVEAMKLGAADFLEKPVELAELESLIERWTGGVTQGERAKGILELPGVPPIVGRDPRFLAALRLLERAAPTESTVLLLGPSGSGKELFARALHALSRRAAGPFVAVNCAAIPESLVESELFGHEKGAFTGADRRRVGRFEQAQGGTLFLDEIGELPLPVQAKLLRVLDGGGFERLGGRERLEANCRVVAATNRDLAASVRQGLFRADLLYRLEVLPVRLPGLAERAGDIVPLAAYLLERHAARHRVAPPSLAEDARRWLLKQPWPGNVRQLSNLMERAVILHPGELLRKALLEELAAPPGEVEPVLASAGTSTSEGERARLEEVLRAHNFELEDAARELGWPLRRLERKLRSYGICPRPGGSQRPQDPASRE